MADIDFQVQIEKDGTLRVVNPATNATLADVNFTGMIMKGCGGAGIVQIQDLHQPGTRRLVQSFDTKFSFGNFKSPTSPAFSACHRTPSSRTRDMRFSLFRARNFLSNSSGQCMESSLLTSPGSIQHCPAFSWRIARTHRSGSKSQ